MERSVRASNTTLATTIFVESKAINSTIDLLACSVGQTIFSHGKVPLVCIYTNINIIMTKRQEINSLIRSARGGASLPKQASPSVDMVVIHLPAEGYPIPVSMVGLEAATASASQYLALLGQNFILIGTPPSCTLSTTPWTRARVSRSRYGF
ncbi:hypothetical protein BC939DRAFT_436965 [Gamsiella multidivaricata]|uniref:uncharacterized protein n=1 Tax=Gamsiella multidivaricata TaxID=101098 RepID=UPI00221E3DEB|nr:uncharacterized protein BC939DRAFT_436965 [Gamsiella multidivaricata]KAI7831416.1 hypothetical protein BC939DRAFT_436965 [Gamsiella multidivaricata]